MQGQIDKANTSGIVHLQDEKIFWNYNDESILQIDFNDIVVIGEFTNSDGPYFDDWFLTFVTKDGHWKSIPWYADNIDEMTTLLCKKFQTDLNVSYLTGSTQWASVVRHPTHLKNKEPFKLTPTENYNKPKTVFDKLLSSVGCGNFDTNQYINLTDEVKDALTNASR